MQLGQRKHLSSTWALERKGHQRWLVFRRFGKRIPTNDAAGPTEALEQHLGSWKEGPSAMAWFWVIRKKNSIIRKKNANKWLSWANGSTWAALVTTRHNVHFCSDSLLDFARFGCFFTSADACTPWKSWHHVCLSNCHMVLKKPLFEEMISMAIAFLACMLKENSIAWTSKVSNKMKHEFSWRGNLEIKNTQLFCFTKLKQFDWLLTCLWKNIPLF